MICHKVHVKRVIDGDTFIADIDLQDELNMSLTKRIRLLGIDAPEKRGVSKERGLFVKAYVESRLKDAKKITLEMIKEDSFGRILSIVYVDGVNLCEELIEKGYALPYRR